MSKKILVVEDEPNMIDLVRRRLKEKDYIVVEALNGQEALIQFEKEKPDLVLIDVVLPDVDGFDVCRKIKKELSPDTLVIVYTGKLEKVDVVRARSSGADELTVKSGNLDVVVDTIQDFLNKKELEDGNNS